MRGLSGVATAGAGRVAGGDGYPDLAHGTTAGWSGLGGWVGIVAMLGLVALACGYGVGVWRLWSRHGAGYGIGRWRVVAVAVGLVVLVGTQIPAVDEAAADSFVAHMVQHMVLLMVVAPLLATGGIGWAVTMSLPRAARGWLARLRAAAPLRWLRTPVPLATVVCLAQALVLWGWHLPTLYQAALDHDVVHLVEHGCFVGAAWLLWAPILGPARHGGFSGLVAVVVVFVAGLPAMALGAIYTFSPVALYPDSMLAPAGGDPLGQQQLAGVVMWIPMNVVYLVISAVGLWRWLAQYDRRIPGDRDLRAPQWKGAG